jgi:hypothetical protein
MENGKEKVFDVEKGERRKQLIEEKKEENVQVRKSIKGKLKR